MNPKSSTLTFLRRWTGTSSSPVKTHRGAWSVRGIRDSNVKVLLGRDVPDRSYVWTNFWWTGLGSPHSVGRVPVCWSVDVGLVVSVTRHNRNAVKSFTRLYTCYEIGSNFCDQWNRGVGDFGVSVEAVDFSVRDY